MVNNNRNSYNFLAASIQVIIISITYFILYRILLVSVGSEKLGLWSLIISASSIANIGNLGISGSIVNFIAIYNAKNESKKINSLIWTSVFTITITITLLSLFLFIISSFILPRFFSGNLLHLAIELLPFTFISLIINSINSIFLSVLDGFELIYIRSIVVCISFLLFLILSIILVKKFNLFGLVYAQITQSIFVFFISVFFVKRYKVHNLFTSFHISKETFRQIVAYGANFQIIAVMSLLFDPITKFFLSSDTSLSSVAYFEIASRFVVQTRSLIVSAAQSIVPVIAQKNAKNFFNIEKYFSEVNKFVCSLSFLIFNIISVVSPIISLLFIGNYQKKFILYLILLSTGWFINLISLAAYIINIGLGKLRANVYYHLILGSSNILLCFLMRKVADGLGIIIALVLSLAVSTIFLNLKFRKHNNLSSRKLFSNNEMGLFFAISFFPVLMFITTIYVNLNISRFYFLIFFLTYFVILVLSLKNSFILKRMKTLLFEKADA